MKIKTQYLALRDLLLPWHEVWGFSVLKSWESMRACMGEENLSSLSKLDLQDQYQFLLGREQPLLPRAFSDFHNGLTNLLRDVLRAPQVAPLTAPLDEGLTPKKNHEIATILAFLKDHASPWEQLLDVGGGAGHLARHLAACWPLSTLSIDREELFQREGKRLLERRPWKNLLQKPFRFLTGNFPECMSGNKDWDPRMLTLSVGLHTCGPLAWQHLELAFSGVEVLNFGCCYDKLDLTKDVERSRWARQYPLSWTSEGLFLITRGGKERGFVGFEFQHRVQNYRFALHHLLNEEFGQQQFISVGQTAARHYQGSFAEYVRNRFVAMGMDCSFSDAQIESFFEKKRPLLQEQWTAALLRNRLARPLELTLILDRALYFEELGFTAEICEFFDPQLSPRNLGILVKEPRVLSSEPQTGHSGVKN